MSNVLPRQQLLRLVVVASSSSSSSSIGSFDTNKERTVGEEGEKRTHSITRGEKNILSSSCFRCFAFEWKPAFPPFFACDIIAHRVFAYKRTNSPPPFFIIRQGNRIRHPWKKGGKCLSFPLRETTSDDSPRFLSPKSKKKGGGEEGFFHPNFFLGKTVFLAGVHGGESEKSFWTNVV